MTGPVHWPSLTAGEAADEWAELRTWVRNYTQRYPHDATVPQCWWLHPDVVELLAALRDHERASFHPTAPASAAMDFQRARQDTDRQLQAWLKKLTCRVPGRDHPELRDPADAERAWQEWVQRDVARRSAAEHARGSTASVAAG